MCTANDAADIVAIPEKFKFEQSRFLCNFFTASLPSVGDIIYSNKMYERFKSMIYKNDDLKVSINIYFLSLLLSYTSES